MQTWKIWTYKVREGPRDSRRISSWRVLYRYWTSFRDFSSNSWNTAFDKRLQLFFRALYPTEVRHWLIFKPFNNRVQNLYINRSHFFHAMKKKNGYSLTTPFSLGVRELWLNTFIYSCTLLALRVRNLNTV